MADYLAPVWAGQQALTEMHRSPAGGTSQLMAEGFERLGPVTGVVAGKPHRWLERRLVLRSCRLA